MEKKYMLDLFAQIAHGIAMQFGPQCEVAVHDLSHKADGTIAAIENGHVTGRKTGEAVRKAHKRPKQAEDQLAYQTQTADGRILKSSALYLRNEIGMPIALFEINYDITNLFQTAETLKQMISTAEGKPVHDEDTEMAFSNVDDLLDCLIHKSREYVGKPVATMAKEDKIRAIHYLEKKGAFLIKKAGDRVSRYYDISKYTLYNYLEADVAK